MADELVRVRIGDIETNMGRVRAEKAGVEILDESARRPDGKLRRDTRKGGRPRKPKTSVAELVAEKRSAPATSGTGGGLSAPTIKE